VQNDTSEEEENSGQDETLNLLTRKFSRFLKRKSRDKTQLRKRYSKLNESNHLITLALAVVNQVTLKLIVQTKDKQVSKKGERSRGKNAYIF